MIINLVSVRGRIGKRSSVLRTKVPRDMVVKGIRPENFVGGSKFEEKAEIRILSTVFSTKL